MMSDTSVLIFEYLLVCCGLYPSLNPVGVIKAPCVDGVETKSHHNSSTSSCTSTVPAPNG